ncbi:MAG: SDR family NAD(P)-dependent oxidoreductase [Candidatus Acidiferrales bacterium]
MEKVALITGTSSGIGRATAALLARSGYRVFGAVRNIPSGEPIRNVDFLQLDVPHDESAKEAVRSLLSRAGRIDALVNNAGYTLIGSTVGREAKFLNRLRKLIPSKLFDKNLRKQFGLRAA